MSQTQKETELFNLIIKYVNPTIIYIQNNLLDKEIYNKLNDKSQQIFNSNKGIILSNTKNIPLDSNRDIIFSNTKNISNIMMQQLVYITYKGLHNSKILITHTTNSEKVKTIIYEQITSEKAIQIYGLKEILENICNIINKSINKQKGKTYILGPKLIKIQAIIDLIYIQNNDLKIQAIIDLIKSSKTNFL